ncbi:MAG: putative glutamate/gamma-aminobutyrate antiporter [Acidobacteria bacterium]|nr:putative glutamate/gamma-aminobutyrate antiporter [Acidobacteriota bacterium]
MENAQSSPQLVRALKLRDLVLFNLVAVLGLRHLGTTAKFGPGSLLMWLIAAIFFFIPQGLAVIELSSRFPKEGGIYFWTKRALGEGHGFLCGWCYWISNVLYYPNLLISAAVIATFIFGEGGSGLSDRWAYVLPVTLGALWLAVAINIVGLGAGKWLQNAGGVGSYVPGFILILLGVYGAMTRPAANVLNATTLTPDLSNLPALNLLASIAFAFAGLELASTMGDEVENPRRNLPRAIFISAPLIAIVYIIGTAAVLWWLPNKDVNVVSGFLQAIKAGADNLSPALRWIPTLCAALYTLGNIGGVGAWLIGPARVAFVIGLDRYFPKAFGAVHPRWHTPYVAILVQATLATVFLLLSVLGRGTSVEEVYLILLDTQILIYFIPYLYLFIVFLIHRRRGESATDVVMAPGGKIGGWFVGLSGIIITLFAMIVATIPPPDNTNPMIFRLKVIGGALGFILIGGVIYWTAKARS